MPHGAPDYWGISYRPSFGGMRRGTFGLAAAPGGETECLEIEGNGIIYGGHVRSQGTATQKTDNYDLFVDGVRVAHPQFEYYNQASLNKEHSGPFYELHYDDAAWLYIYGIMPGITFESSFRIRYTEGYTRAPLLFGEISYSLI